MYKDLFIVFGVFLLPTIQITMKGFYSVMMLKYKCMLLNKNLILEASKIFCFPYWKRQINLFNSNSLSKIKEQNIIWSTKCRALKVGSFGK